MRYAFDFLKLLKLLQSNEFYSDSLFSLKVKRYDEGYNVVIQATSNPRLKRVMFFPADKYPGNFEIFVNDFLKQAEDNRNLKRWLVDKMKIKDSPDVRVLGTESLTHFELLNLINIKNVFELQELKPFTFGLR